MTRGKPYDLSFKLSTFKVKAVLYWITGSLRRLKNLECRATQEILRLKQTRHKLTEKRRLGVTSDSFLLLNSHHSVLPILTLCANCLPISFRVKAKIFNTTYTMYIPASFTFLLCLTFLFAHSDCPSCHDFLP